MSQKSFHVFSIVLAEFSPFFLYTSAYPRPPTTCTSLTRSFSIKSSYLWCRVWCTQRMDGARSSGPPPWPSAGCPRVARCSSNQCSPFNPHLVIILYISNSKLGYYIPPPIPSFYTPLKGDMVVFLVRLEDPQLDEADHGRLLDAAVRLLDIRNIGVNIL